MKFFVNDKNSSDMGLLVKHGNRDNVVLFFDEIESAAGYSALLFRTDADFPNEGFLKEQKPEKSMLYVNNYGEFNNASRTQQYSVEKLSDALSPSFFETTLLIEQKQQIGCNYYQTERTDKWEYNTRNVMDVYSIKRIDFDLVKFITRLDGMRNDLYFNIDFLPCGAYFVIVQAENRSGELIAQAMPYYFKVKEKSDDAIIKAIRDAGHAAGPHYVG